MTLARPDDRVAASGLELNSGHSPGRIGEARSGPAAAAWSLAAAGLAIATAIFYWPVTFGGGIFSDYDLLVYFYPYQQFLGEQLRSGNLPLWNPYLFAGVPFLANLQAAAFYPPSWLAALLPPPYLTTVLTLGHVWLAAFGVVVFGRQSVRLGWPASLVAGLIFAWGGFLTQQASHPNQLAAAAWLPWLLIVFDQAHQSRQRAWLAAGCLVVAAMLLAGHSQEAYYGFLAGGVFAAWRAAQAGIVREGDGRRWQVRPRRLLEPLLTYLAIAAGGALLAAVQLLPAAELSRLGIRSGGLTFDAAAAFSLPPWLLHRGLLPFGGGALPTPEYIGYTGVLGLGLAAAGLLTRHPLRWFFLTLALGGLLLALGGYDPLFYLAYRVVPGVGLFRVPARWLLWFSLGVALLAGLGTERLLAGGCRSWRTRRGRVLVVGLVGAAVLWLLAPTPVVGLGWVALTLAGVLLVLDPRLVPLPVPAVPAGLLVLLVAAELWLAGRSLTGNQVTHPQAWFSIRPAIAQLLSDPAVYRVLSVSAPTFEPGDRNELTRTYGERLSAEGPRAMFVALKLRELLSPNLPLAYQRASLDGYDGGLLPLRSYLDFKDALIAVTRTQEASRVDTVTPQPDGLLLRELRAVPPTDTLSALNVKYIIVDKTLDPWIDGVYYDLGLTERLGPAATWQRQALPEFEATRLGLVSYLEGADALPAATTVATATILTRDGRRTIHPLQSGRETAAGMQSVSDPAGLTPRLASRWLGTDQGFNFLATLDLEAPGVIESITIEGAGHNTLVLRGLSLIDGRTGASAAVTLRPEFTVVQSGDLKVYRNEAVRPRGFLIAADPALGGDQPDLATFLRDPPITGDPALGSAELIDYGPGRARFDVAARQPGRLLFTEMTYPGWRARLDGQPVPVEHPAGVFQSVAVPAGAHTIEFHFTSDTFRAGLAVSVVSLVALAALTVWQTRRRRVRQP